MFSRWEKNGGIPVLPESGWEGRPAGSWLLLGPSTLGGDQLAGLFPASTAAEIWAGISPVNAVAH